jgi:rod shape-determining protein MreD
MGTSVGALILLVSAILQASLLPFLTSGAGTPNFVFLFVLAWSINADIRQSVTWALIGGIALDLLSALPLGTSALGLLLVVGTVTGLGDRVYRVGVLWLAGLVLAGSLFFEGYRLLAVFIFRAIGTLPQDAGAAIDVVSDFNTVVLPTIVYNFILIWFVYFIVRRIQRRLREPVS